MKYLLYMLIVFTALNLSCSGSSRKPDDPWPNVDTVENSMAKYESMSEPELESVLKEIQRKESEAEKRYSTAKSEYETAEGNYRLSGESGKPDALVRMLDAKAEMEAASATFRELQRELFAAKEVFVKKKSAP